MPRVVAVSGKGGTGKTLLATLLLRALLDTGARRILAIDADSAVSLPFALGVPFGRSLAELRDAVIADPALRKELADRHVREAIAEIVTRGPGFDLLVMGRPEGPGCYCVINDLLRYGIESLSKGYDVVIVDGEAGPEQINRRVLSAIDTLVVVADRSARAMRCASEIAALCASRAAPDRTRRGLVLNRVRDGTVEARQAAERIGVELLGVIPEDEGIAACDAEGRPLIALPADDPAVRAARLIHDSLFEERS